MKIIIGLNKRYGRYGRRRIDLHEIQSSTPFTMFGFTFAAHPPVDEDGKLRDPKKHGWVISEISSGAVAAHGDLRRKAIENAKKVMEKIGEEKVREAIMKQKALRDKGVRKCK